MRKTFLRRPRKPFAAFSTFLCAARAVTPRLTRGMSRLLLVGQHRLQGALVGRVSHRGAAQMALTLLCLFREDVAQVRAAALEPAAGELLETLRRAALRLEFRHGLTPVFIQRQALREETCKAWTTACCPSPYPLPTSWGEE